MYLTIRHDVAYRYEATVHYSIQQLRLTPASGAAQVVRRWSIDAPGKLDATFDAYGNVLHTLVLNKPHSELRLHVSGEVDTIPLVDGCCAMPSAPFRSSITPVRRGSPRPMRRCANWPVRYRRSPRRAGSSNCPSKSCSA